MGDLEVLSTGRAPAAAPLATERWFLSFDPATKSFAWSLLRVLVPSSATAAEVARLSAAETLSLADVARAGELARLLRHSFALVAGGAVDLAPGQANSELSSVERIRALTTYVQEAILPEMRAAPGCPGAGTPEARSDLNVVVEFQMGANAPSRMVAHSLITLFINANVFGADPKHKNRLRFEERRDLDHCYFYERYAKAYDANKNHADAIYHQYIAPLFGHPALPTVPRGFRKDFADSVVQVLGHLVFGDQVAPETHF